MTTFVPNSDRNEPADAPVVAMNSDLNDISVADLINASRCAEVIDAMRDFYAETDRLIAVHQPQCANRGLCCRFGEFGHRLYVTSLEVAYYLSGHPVPPVVEDDICPHAYDAACHARDHRPMGCRIFYCDPAAASWQGPLTEERLATLRTLHEKLNVPYIYADWMTFLKALRAHATSYLTS